MTSVQELAGLSLPRNLVQEVPGFGIYFPRSFETSRLVSKVRIDREEHVCSRGRSDRASCSWLVLLFPCCWLLLVVGVDHSPWQVILATRKRPQRWPRWTRTKSKKDKKCPTIKRRQKPKKRVKTALIQARLVQTFDLNIGLNLKIVPGPGPGHFLDPRVGVGDVQDRGRSHGDTNGNDGLVTGRKNVHVKNAPDQRVLRVGDLNIDLNLKIVPGHVQGHLSHEEARGHLYDPMGDPGDRGPHPILIPARDPGPGPGLVPALARVHVLEVV